MFRSVFAIIVILLAKIAKAHGFFFEKSFFKRNKNDFKVSLLRLHEEQSRNK